MVSYSSPERIVRRGRLTRAYYTRVYDRETGMRSWKSTGCKSLKTAEEWVKSRELEAAMGRQRTDALAARTLTFEAAADAWFKDKVGKVSDHHYDSLDGLCTKFWKPYFGTRVLREITAPEITKYLRKRKAGVLPESTKPLTSVSVNQDRKDLAALFNWCVRQGWIDRNPILGVDRFSGVPRRRTRYISREEEDRLLAACRESPKVLVKARRNLGGSRGRKVSEKPTSFRQTVPTPDYLYPLVLTAVRCGLRRGTLIALQWQNIIFDAGQLSIEAEKMKADEDYSAPVPPSVLEALKAYREQLAVKWAKRRRNPLDRIGPDATVFGLSESTNVLRPFKAACRRAGLSLTFHDLRRIFLNRCREAGVSIETAMRLSDHRTFETVRRHYREIQQQELVAAVRAIDGAPPRSGKVITVEATTGPDADGAAPQRRPRTGACRGTREN